MTQATRRLISTIAIIIASVAFGVLLTMDLGLASRSNAQAASTEAQRAQGPVAMMTIPSFADVASRVMPAVVSITTTEVFKDSDLRKRGQLDPFDYFFPGPGMPNPHRRRGEEDDEHEQKSGGSGFIISPDGYILTNNHVVENATKVEVHYGADDSGEGGHTVTAKIVGRDPSTDVALVKIEVSRQLPIVPLGDSDRIRKGDWAIAIGNPFQFENTLTVGVISAKGRSLGLSSETRSFENFIQTDAAINFGNSGGPLLNINGEVIGINTAIRGGGAQNLGFATPINTAKQLLPQLKKGKVVRSYLGMSITDINDETRAALSLPSDRGAFVQNVTPDKPADRAGIQAGDVIIQVNDHQVRRNRDLIDYISAQPVGSTIKVTVLREGQQKTLSAVTAERPPDTELPRADQNAPGGQSGPTRNKIGISVQELSPAVRQMYGIDNSIQGIVITNVKEVSPAAEKVQEGDVIISANGQKITNIDQFRKIVEDAKPGQYLRLYVSTPAGRAGGSAFSRFAFIQVP
jgi:serine protease Do